MLIFLYGDNSYLMRQKLVALKEKYISANQTDTDLLVLEAKGLDPKDLTQHLLAMPFLVSSRLIVINDLFEAKQPLKDHFQTLAEKIPSSTVVVVAESGSPKKTDKLFKLLTKVAKTQQFDLIDARQLTDWIKDYLKSRHASIDASASTALVQRSQGNMWQLQNVLDQLASYTHDRSEENRLISVNDVDLFIKDFNEANVFSLLDALLDSNESRRLKILKNLLSQGENEHYLLAMITSAIKNIALINDAITLGHSTNAEIAQYTTLKPFVVGKYLSIARRLTSLDIVTAYEQVLFVDIAIKRGIMEPDMALEWLAMTLFSEYATEHLMKVQESLDYSLS